MTVRARKMGPRLLCYIFFLEGSLPAGSCSEPCGEKWIRTTLQQQKRATITHPSTNHTVHRAVMHGAPPTDSFKLQRLHQPKIKLEGLVHHQWPKGPNRKIDWLGLLMGPVHIRALV